MKPIAHKHVKYPVKAEDCDGEVDSLNKMDIPHTYDMQGPTANFKAHYADKPQAKKLHTHLKKKIDAGDLEQGQIEGFDDLDDLAAGEALEAQATELQ